MTQDPTLLDAIVVGGGAAGLSAALTLGRARRSTLVVDAGAPSNAAATVIGGLLGREGVSPAQLVADGRAELGRYRTVRVEQGEVVSAEHCDDDTFAVTLADGSQRRANRLLLASGARYELPDLPGVAERFGRTVFHCPFCHGWELRDQALAVLGVAGQGLATAAALTRWTSHVTFLSNGTPVTDADRELFSAAGIIVDERDLTSVGGDDTALDVCFTDGGSSRFAALQVKTPIRLRSRLGEQLGATVLRVPPPTDVEVLSVQPNGATDVPGLFAAGDTALTTSPSVAAAISSGYAAGAGLVYSLR